MTKDEVEELQEIIRKEKMRRHLLDFMKGFWRKKGTPLKVGLHTRSICDKIDEAIKKYDEGISSYIIITVPFRHGKSDIVSRYLPAYFIGNHPDDDIMVVSYSGGLSQGFTRFARDIVKTKQYEEVFDRELSKENSSSTNWQLQDSVGVVVGSGITSGITGKGYSLGILDDFCAGRAEAESKLIRDKTWEGFADDFFTRQAPVSITIILATPWHVDDVIGRIKKKTDPKNESYDPNFQKFELVSYPAKDGVAIVKNNLGEWEEVKYDYLFTEKTLSTGEKIDGRFSAQWYERQFASLGEYSASALLQCNPTTKGGNLINVSKVTIHHNVNEFPNIKYYRIWDLAHTQKQTQKDDPDWTSGTLLAYRKIDGDKWELWIKDVARIRANAPERDNFIRSVAEKDGASVTVAVENSIESKDALAHLQFIFNGRRIVRGITCKGDKVSRISYVEPIFDGGNVHILSGGWNLDWFSEIKEFPSGKHDDQVDNISAGFELCCNSNGVPVVGGVIGW